MKKLLLFTVLLLIFFSTGFSQVSWEVDETQYEFSSSFIGYTEIDGIEATDTMDVLSVWSKGEIRGITKPLILNGSPRLYYLAMVYSNTSEDTLTFKFYDASEDSIYNLTNSANFKIDEIYGDFSTPYVFSNAYRNLLNGFGFVGISSSYVFEEETKSILISVPQGTDQSRLIADFDFQFATSVLVNGIEQINLSTVNDFTQALIYEVKTASGDYQFTVSVTTDTLTSLGEIPVSKTKVFPNPFREKIKVLTSEKESITILNENGQIVYNIDANMSEYNLSHLKKGAYLLVITSENGDFYSERILKE